MAWLNSNHQNQKLNLLKNLKKVVVSDLSVWPLSCNKWKWPAGERTPAWKVWWLLHITRNIQLNYSSIFLDMQMWFMKDKVFSFFIHGVNKRYILKCNNKWLWVNNFTHRSKLYKILSTDIKSMFAKIQIPLKLE